MPFYLSEYVGTGTVQDPFRAVGSEQDGAAAIDLRPDASRADGGGLNACLLKTPVAFTDARARFLADDKLESLTNPQRNFLQNRLGIDLSSATLLRDIIATIMTMPPSNRWKAIVPGRLRWEIWFAGELLWEAPRASGGATDDFNRANETPLASPWTKLLTGASNTNLSANTAVSAGESMYGYTGSVTSADHYSQVVAPNATTNEAGPACRCRSTGGGEAYLVVLGGFHNFYKLVGASYTSILSTGTLESNGATCRLEVEGSSLRYYQNGVLSSNSPQTDTSITAVGVSGMRFGNASEVLDDWDGNDLNPPVFQDLRPDADVTTTGWTTTPLWSKIEETSADGTVITATAS